MHEKATLFLRRRELNHGFKLAGGKWKGNLLGLLREYHEENLKEINPRTEATTIAKDSQESIDTNATGVTLNLIKPFSEIDMISFGNFIRDNYYGVGAPKLISYNHSKYPHGTIEEIFLIWLIQK